MRMISARLSGRFPRTAPRTRGALSSLLLRHHYRHYCWTKAALRVAFSSLSPTTLLSRRHLGFCPSLLSPSLPPSPFYVSAPTPASSSPLSPSSLFYLNLPQICSPTKQLPSLFWAIMCGRAARAGPPGRQSPGNRVSAGYCGVCPSRSITRRLTPRGRQPESPLGHSRNLRPGPPSRTRPQEEVTGLWLPPEGHGLWGVSRSWLWLVSSTLQLSPGGRLQTPHFAGVKWAQRGEVICPWSHSTVGAELGHEPGYVCSEACGLKYQVMLFPRTCFCRTVK